MTKFSRFKSVSIMLSLSTTIMLLAGCATANDSPDTPNDNNLSGATDTVENYLEAVDNGDSDKALEFVTEEIPKGQLGALLSDKYLKKGKGIKATLTEPTQDATGEVTVEGTSQEGKLVFKLAQDGDTWSITQGAFYYINIPANEYIPEVSINEESFKIDSSSYQQSGEVTLSGFPSHYTVSSVENSKFLSFPEVEALATISTASVYDISFTTLGETELVKQTNEFIDNCYTGGLTGDERTKAGCPNVRVFASTIEADTIVTWEKTSENPKFEAGYKDGDVALVSSDILTQNYTFKNETYEWPVNMSGTATYENGNFVFSFLTDPIKDNLIEGVSL